MMGLLFWAISLPKQTDPWDARRAASHNGFLRGLLVINAHMWTHGWRRAYARLSKDEIVDEDIACWAKYQAQNQACCADHDIPAKLLGRWVGINYFICSFDASYDYENWVWNIHIWTEKCRLKSLKYVRYNDSSKCGFITRASDS